MEISFCFIVKNQINFAETFGKTMFCFTFLCIIGVGADEYYREKFALWSYNACNLHDFGKQWYLKNKNHCNFCCLLANTSNCSVKTRQKKIELNKQVDSIFREKKNVVTVSRTL